MVTDDGGLRVSEVPLGKIEAVSPVEVVSRSVDKDSTDGLLVGPEKV